MIWSLDPHRGVGGVLFGSDIRIYQSKFSLKIVNDDDDLNEIISYTNISEDIRIDVLEDKIYSVSCYSNLYINDINIIGKNASSIAGFLNLNLIKDELIWVNDHFQTTYKEHNLGIMCWIDGLGIIVSADCYAIL